MTRVASTQLRRTPSGGLEIRNGGGCLVVFGLPFLLAGLAGFAKGVQQVVERLPALDLESLLLLPFTLVFVAAGLLLIMVRWGVSIERGTGLAAAWWSVGPLGRRREAPLASFSRVSLVEDSSGESTSWEASLDGPEVKKLQVVNTGSETEARRVAEQVAEELSLPLSDRSHGAEVVRQPGTFDEPLIERLRRTDAFPYAAPPPSLRSTVVDQGTGVRIEIGPTGAALSVILPLIFGGVFLAFAGPPAARILRGLLPAPWADVVLVAAAALILLPPLLGVAPGIGRRTVVMASPTALRVETRTLLRRHVVEMPANEVEELIAPDGPTLIDDGSERGAALARTLRDGVDASGAAAPRWLRFAARMARYKGIAAVSDAASVTFAQGLPEEEQAYLAARIVAALAGR